MSPSPKLSGIRILADEDVSFKLVRPLKKLGVDIRPDLKGLKNGELFQRSIHESRILLTHDNDFADSIRYPASKTQGIIIMKIHPPVESELLAGIKKLFEETSPESINGKLVFLTKAGYSIE